MNKILSSIVICCLFSMQSYSQQKFQTFVYTSDDLAKEIQQRSNEMKSRGYMSDLFMASKDAAKGIGAGYVTSFFDMGVNAVGSLLTRNARAKEQWEETIKAENVWQTQISTIAEINDFYKETSFDGAMDPKGMRFDGIGCLRKEGNDTLFYISCHIDRTKINRIINHSKFQLVLDTLIVSPAHSNLPNTNLDIPYSYEERQNFTLSMKIKLISSWMNEIVQLHKDQELGEFSINVPVSQSDLDGKGFLRYVREQDASPKYAITGESFIVPRSYMGFRDADDNFKNSWGTGEYKLSIALQETCDATQQLRKNWKQDRKRHKDLQGKNGLISRGWQIVSSQQWDEVTKSWVITTLMAPAEIITKDAIKKLDLQNE